MKQNIVVAVVNKEAVGITGVILLLPGSTYVCKLMLMIPTNALLSDPEITCDQLWCSVTFGASMQGMKIWCVTLIKEFGFIKNHCFNRTFCLKIRFCIFNYQNFATTLLTVLCQCIVIDYFKITTHIYSQSGHYQLKSPMGIMMNDGVFVQIAKNNWVDLNALTKSWKKKQKYSWHWAYSKTLIL